MVARNESKTISELSFLANVHSAQEIAKGEVPFPKMPSGVDSRLRQNHRIIESDVCDPARAQNVCSRPVQVAEPT